MLFNIQPAAVCRAQGMRSGGEGKCRGGLGVGIVVMAGEGQLPKGVTRPCRVELQEKERLLYILRLGQVKTLAGPSAKQALSLSCNSTRHERNSFGLLPGLV